MKTLSINSKLINLVFFSILLISNGCSSNSGDFYSNDRTGIIDGNKESPTTNYPTPKNTKPPQVLKSTPSVEPSPISTKDIEVLFSGVLVFSNSVKGEVNQDLYKIEFECGHLNTSLCKTEIVQITDTKGVEWRGVISPDGLIIAYLYSHDPFSRSDIGLYNLQKESNEYEYFVQDIRDIAWNPKSNSLIYTKESSSGSKIIIWDITSNHSEQIQTNSIWNEKPIWSPDGEVIAYFASDIGDYIKKIRIFTINDGVEKEVLQHTIANSVNRISWSNDSKKIVFTGIINGNHDIYILNIETNELTKITESSAFDTSPQWSPIDNVIVFSSNRNGDYDLFIYDIELGETIQINENIGQDIFPQWTKDGKYIFFINRSGDNSILKVLDLGKRKEYYLTANSFNVFSFDAQISE